MTAMKKRLAQATLKPLGAAIASLVTLSAVTAIKPAHAFSVTSDFTVQITSDAYANQGVKQGATASGRFTYDNASLTGIGSERVSDSKGNLTLQFNFLNKLYTEQNDRNYSINPYDREYPAALFEDGKLLGLDLVVVPAPLQPPPDELGFRIFKDAFYVGATDDFQSFTLAGTVTYGGSAAAVPEPSEMGGAIVAFSFLGLLAMRKGKGQKA